MSRARFGFTPTFFFLAALTVLLTACGGGGGSSGSSNSGSVGIVLTDGPTADFAEVNVTITEIKLMADDEHDGNGDVVLFQGEQTVDLLNLTDFSTVFALNTNVPAGKYEKIRLQLKQPHGIELVKKDALGNVIDTIYPKMSGNGKLDLNPRHDFYVLPNQALYLQVDIDADKSLHVVKTGNGGYRFRPVVFVDIIGQQFSGKLVRQFGYVRNLDTINNRFKLCDSPLASVDPTTTGSESTTAVKSMHVMEGCLTVMAGSASVFSESGEPMDLSGLVNNQMLTAIGFIRHNDENEAEDNLGEEDNEENNGSTESPDRSSHHEDDDDIRLLAEVLEVGSEGSFAVVDGTIASEPQTEADAFALTLPDSTEISAQLQMGTKVFSRSGERLDYQAINMGLTASVDGVYSALNSSILNSALVVVDTAMAATMEKISGQVLAVDTLNRIITISTGTGEQMIRVGDTTNIFLLEDNGSGALSSAIDITAIPANAVIDVYGHANIDGYFDADTIIVEAAAATL